MTFRQLEYFLEVARTLNFSKAAENLFVSQSTLSKAISMLETELGAVLFLRDRHKVSLTPAGAVLATNLPRLREDLAKTIDLVQEVKEGMRGRLALGVQSGFMLPDVIISAMNYCKHSMPFLATSVTSMNDDKLQDALANGTVDFAFAYRIEGDAHQAVPGTNTTVLESHQAVLCVSRLSGLRDEPTPKDLSRLAYAFSEPREAAPVRRWFDYCRTCGFYPNIVRATDVETAAAMVELGMAAAVVSENHALAHSRNVRALPIPDAYRIASTMTSNASNLNQIVEVFTRLVESDL